MTTHLSRSTRYILWFLAIVASLAPRSSALAWDREGHAIIARLAIAAMPETMPAWLRTPQVRARLIYLSSEPDRWRGQHNVHLDHVNAPDHYMDEELLHPYGLSIKTLPPLRREFTDLMATERALHPERFKPYDRRRDRKYTRLSPGMLPYRIAELQWKTAASWTALKTYEAHRSDVSDEMIQNARQNVVYHMGILSHYVGDGAQPLHTTEHYNGWTGPNPEGYTTDKGFHSFIDGGILDQFDINSESLLGRVRSPRRFSAKGYWLEICGFLYETHRLAEPLYRLEKSGELYKLSGKKFIEERMLEGGAALAGIWVAAYEGAVIDDFRVRELEESRRKRLGEKARTRTSSGSGD